MYILFFGLFIFFLDNINFVMQLKKRKKRANTGKRNLIGRYIHACDERNGFIRANHYLCMIGIVISILVQVASFFTKAVERVWLEWAVLFLICFLVYLAGYQCARALWLHFQESRGRMRKGIFLISFLGAVFAIAVTEIYMIACYIGIV